MVMVAGYAEENAALLVKQHEPRYGSTTASAASTIVGFNPDHDPENPRNWPSRFKWGIVVLMSFASFTVTFNCTSVVPVARQIVEDLDGVSAPSSAPVMAITIWEIGEAVGPLLIGPLSETTGRYPMILAGNLLFILATVLAAFSSSSSMFTVLRALTGAAVTSNVLNPAIVGDMFEPELRGTALSFPMFALLLGGTLGPSLGGFVTAALGWRAVIWLGATLACVSGVTFGVLFRETYGPVILRRRAARLRRETGDNTITYVPEDGSGNNDDMTRIRSSVTRPATVLFGSRVLTALAMFGAAIYAMLLVLATTLPDILDNGYGLSTTGVGSAFMINGLGTFLGVLASNMYLDKIYLKLRKANNGIGLPEHRLPLAILGSLLVPLTSLLYGWCAEFKLPLAFLLLSTCLMRLGLLLVMIPIMAYVVDASGIYSASALTGVIVLRCLAGAFIPLVVNFLAETVGYGWGFTVISSVCFVLALIPLLILRYGPQWRKHCEYTKTRGGE